jgi:hypothetical protein
MSEHNGGIDMNKLLIWAAIGMGLLAGMPVHAQGLFTKDGIAYIEVDGASAYQVPIITRNIGIRGVCIGAGKGFIDMRCSTDGKIVRCTWPWETKPGKDAKILAVGQLEQPGRLGTHEVNIVLSL